MRRGRELLELELELDGKIDSDDGIGTTNAPTVVIVVVVARARRAMMRAWKGGAMVTVATADVSDTS